MKLESRTNIPKPDKFIVVIISILLAFWGSIILDSINIHIPVLRQSIGFIFLTFILGILFLRIIGIYEITSIENILYSLGLSILMLMLVGLLLNVFLPFIGIIKPLTEINFIIAVSLLAIILCAITFYKERNNRENYKINQYIQIKDLFQPSVLLFINLPFLSILGSYLVNMRKDNSLLMALIIIIAIYILFLGFYYDFNSKYNCIMIWLFSLSLLYHRSLISSYLIGWDINVEYYFFSLMRDKAFWDTNMEFNINAVLSSTMLTLIYSKVLNLDGILVYKILIQFIYSLVPVSLYILFRKKIGESAATISILYFIFIFTFFTEMTTLIRQEIAEIFLAIFLLNLYLTSDAFKKKILSVSFLIGLIVSHYGLTYMFIFLFFVYIAIIYATKRKYGSFTFMTYIFTFIFSYAWYLYNSNGSVITSTVVFGNIIISCFYRDLLSPETSAGPATLLTQLSWSDSISEYLLIISMIIITVGFLGECLLRLKTRFPVIQKILIIEKIDDDFVAFAVASYTLLLACLFIPHFAGMNIRRMFHILLFILAPFFAIGLQTLYKITYSLKSYQFDRIHRHGTKIVAIYLSVFLLFNTGFISEVTGDHPYSLSLSQQSILNGKERSNLYKSMVTDQDVYGIKWISSSRDDKQIVLGDMPRETLVFQGYGEILNNIPNGADLSEYILTNKTKIVNESYVFLGYPNVIYGRANSADDVNQYWNVSDLNPQLKEKSTIFSNGGCLIYK